MNAHTRSLRATSAVVAAASLLALAGCSSTDSASPEASATESSTTMPLPEFDQKLQDMFPADIVESGTLRLATITFPPYSYKDEDGTTDIGINWDMVPAIEAATGLTVELEVAPTIADVFTGFTSDRYDASISPLSDIPATEENYDFANWLSEYVVFLQPKSATDKVDSLDAACGKTIATLKGGQAQKVLENAQADCGAKAIDIALYADQDTAVLAVKSGRADAAFSSQIPLTYYVERDSSLTLSGANSTDNGFPPFWVGAFAPKGSGMAEPLLATLNALKEAGTYDAILKKYGIEQNAMDEFGINLAKK